MTTQSPEVAPRQDPLTLGELMGGDLVATPLPLGRRMVVSFQSPYELHLSIDGRAVLHRPLRQDLRALIYVTRRVPVLYAALGVEKALVLDEMAPGCYAAGDIYHIENNEYLDHEGLLQQVARLEVTAAPFAYIGTPSHEGELRRLLEALTAMGDALEIRREKGGKTVQRAVFYRGVEGARVRDVGRAGRN